MKRFGAITATAASLMLTSALALAQSGSSPGAGSGSGGGAQQGPTAAPGSGSSEGGTKAPDKNKATQSRPSGEGGVRKTQSPAEERSGRHERRNERGEKRNSQQEQKGERNRRSEEPATRQNREGGKSSTAKAGEENKSERNNSKARRGGHASLTKEQRMKISRAVRSQHVRVENDINFSIHVGRTVPASIHFYPVPVEIVEFYPEYRGYDYFVADDEIIVVSPRTREIVAVLPYV